MKFEIIISVADQGPHTVVPFESRIHSNIYFLQILTNVKRVAQLCAFALIVRMETVELTLTHMAVILNCSCANGYRLLGKTNCVGT